MPGQSEKPRETHGDRWTYTCTWMVTGVSADKAPKRTGLNKCEAPRNIESMQKPGLDSAGMPKLKPWPSHLSLWHIVHLAIWLQAKNASLN